MLNNTATPGNHPFLNQVVLVRCRNAGVHYGTLHSFGDFIWLKDSRRIWKWEGAFTLSEVGQKGVSGGRIACSIPDLTLQAVDVGEIQLISGEAKTKLDSIHE